LLHHQNYHVCRDNSSSGNNAGRYNTGLGAATSQAFRRYNNPLSMFAENFLDRLPVGGGGGGGSTAVGDVTFSSYSTTTAANTTTGGGGGGEGSIQLSRIDESGSGLNTGHINLCSTATAGGGGGLSSSSHQVLLNFLYYGITYYLFIMPFVVFIVVVTSVFGIDRGFKNLCRKILFWKWKNYQLLRILCLDK
jgi:hypothetical protein